MLKKEIVEQKEHDQEIRPEVYFGVLKPYGKVMGNNVFTHHQPNLEELVNTLHGFPKPVYWLTSESFTISPIVQGILSLHTVLKIKPTSSRTENEISIADLSHFFVEHAYQNAMIVISCNEKETKEYAVQIEEIIENLKRK